jgi:hypothetical protein
MSLGRAAVDAVEPPDAAVHVAHPAQMGAARVARLHPERRRLRLPRQLRRRQRHLRVSLPKTKTA